ncbi:hypothetical protein [Klebsiella aerogenes]|uniref:hypothetical protein n=1 Tax=Klebsiella aerogenes TaxID=548 RepID=UPI001D0D1BF1|nr:hypothetical protein [Klebsiella aerogenes]
MIPDYLTFIRRQDRSLLPYLYFICILLIALYVKNRGYLLTQEDAFPVSAIFSLTMFSFVYELKGYRAYKYEIGNINFSWFQGKIASRFEVLLWHPLVATGCCFIVCYLAVKACLFFFADYYRNGLYCLFCADHCLSNVLVCQKLLRQAVTAGNCIDA